MLINDVDLRPILPFYLNVFKPRKAYAWIGLWFFACTTLPFNLLHHHFHENEVICDKDTPIIEEDPCHVKIYHAGSDKTACKHTAHLKTKGFICATCEFFKTPSIYIQTEWAFPFLFTCLAELNALFKYCVSTNLVLSFSNKGPPLQ